MERRLVLAAALLLLPPLNRAAGDAALDRGTLKGLKSVGVVVDVIDPELQKLGITRDVLITRLLGRLQGKQIVIDPAAKEFVGLRITAVRGNRGPYAAALSFGLYQPVILSRDKDIRTSTQTWEIETVLMADPKLLLTACGESADELADRFATAYYAVNPK